MQPVTADAAGTTGSRSPYLVLLVLDVQHARLVCCVFAFDTTLPPISEKS